MTRHRRLLAAALCAAAVLATRARFLASTLEDVDSVNFALAVVDDYDPARHQPHPPGYPVYVAVAKTAALLSGTEPSGIARTLAWVSALAQAALPIPLFLLFRRLGAGERVAAAAAALTLLNPVVWINGLRPMSDSVGLLFVVCTQVVLLGTGAGRGLRGASLLAGIAGGVRIQALALTLPAWAYATWRADGTRRRLLAAAVLAGAILAWAIPTILQSGGVASYGRAFAGTATDAAVEPLVSGWTLNRAVRAMRYVVLRPWGTEWLGAAMGALAVAGAFAARRGPVSLRLAALLFAPYLVAHALFQQAHTQRYAMPYVPLMALLAVLGMDAVARALAGRRAEQAFVGLAAVAAAAVGAVALPGVAAYSGAASPPMAALGGVRDRGGAADGYVLSGHYVFRRYFAMAPPGIPLVPPRPGREVEGLQAWWLAGGDRAVLFLAEPRRTDLESIDPRARVERGRWAWPPAVTQLLSGERPDAAALVELRPPAWFTGRGWGLSLEMARPAGTMAAVRTAHLASSRPESLLLFAGEPVADAAAEIEGELRLGGRVLDRRRCGSPWMAAYALPATAGAGSPYEPLTFVTFRAGAGAEAPFALRGLALGSPSEALVVHGSGWHYPETSADGRPFRWASGAARSIVNVPPGGGRLVVEGEVPAALGSAPLRVAVESQGARVSADVHGRFRLALDLPPGPPREVWLRAGREFMPDDVQRNGDRRRLALRVESYTLTARWRARPP